MEQPTAEAAAQAHMPASQAEPLVPLAAALDRAAARWADQVGWAFDDAPVTFSDMRHASMDVARALVHAGIGVGDVVAVWMPNLFEFAATQFACGRIGAILTALNTRSKEVEVRHTLSHSGAKVLIMIDTFLKHDFRDTLLTLYPEIAGSSGLVALAGLPSLRQVVSLSEPGDEAGDHATPWHRFLRDGQAVAPATIEAAQRNRTLHEAVLLQYTSGTTARPKGALLGNQYVTYLGGALMHAMGVGANEAVLNTQPFYHIGGSTNAVTAPVAMGCRMVVPSYYEPGAVLAAIERHRCVARTGYGAMYIMEMSHPAFTADRTRSLRTGWCVGPPELLAEVQARMGIPGLLQIYGSTEANGTSGLVSDTWQQRSHTCGQVLPGTEIRVADPATSQPCPAGTDGEVLLRGPYCMIGYLGQPEETAKVIDAEGWFHTGDLGMLDADGFLHFRGRLKNMLKVGGENVSAEEVELVLLQHPAIRQAAVFGVPDPRLQEVVGAAIELRDGATLTEADVTAYCAARMANFRVPRQVRFVSDWPMTGSGKIQRHLVRAAVLGA